MSVQQGDLVAGRYRLGAPLGPAWRARDERDDVDVVLVPAPDDNPDATTWRDRHGILPVTGTATGDDGAWLTAEPTPARTLSDAVAQWGTLPAEQVLTIAAGAVSALTGIGPHPSTTADHILLTDDGKVLLLPIPTPDNALFDLGAALFLAAEGRSAFEPSTAEPRQPTLAGLIRGLMQKDPDHAAALDRTFAELSRLNAPFEAEHGADTLLEAQVASAAAAEDADVDADDDEADAESAPAVDLGDEPTHVTQPHEAARPIATVDVPTQPMTALDLLGETGEADVVAAADADESAVEGDAEPAEADVAPTDDADSSEEQAARPIVFGHEPTEAAAGPLAETDSAEDQTAHPVALGQAATEAAEVGDAPAAESISAADLLADTGRDVALAIELGTRPINMADLLADTTDDVATRPAPSVAASDAIPTGPVADAEPFDDEATRPVPSIAASDAIPTAEAAPATETRTEPADDGATRPVPSVALSDAIPTGSVADAEPFDDEPTRPGPSIAANDAIPTIEAPAEPIPADPPVIAVPTQPINMAELLAETGESVAVDDEATRPVPTIAPDSRPEPPPTKLEPLPAATAAIVAPTLGADAVPPTMAAAPVPPPPTMAAAHVPPPQPQPQPQFQPQQPQSTAPPTQAASAYVPPPPGAPNPWLQPPQQPQSQPQPNPWQNPGGGPGGPGAPGAPGASAWGQNQPFYPMQPPAPKSNTGKTVGIIIGAVAAVAAVVLVVVLATKGNGKSDKVGNTGNSSSHSSSSGGQAPGSVPGTDFSSSAASSSSPSASDSASDTESPSDTSSSSDAYSPPPVLTSTPFDPTVLNEQSTDKTPLSLEALVPQDFTDDKGVHYKLAAGSVQPCVQTDMSANLKDILTSNSCTKEIAASFVDDSGQYLVSVKVLPLPDQKTATVVYNDLSQQNAADFGIWCPLDGPGSAACKGDYRSATIKQYREQQHRYIVLSVALAVNHSEQSDIAPWLDAAAKKGVDTAGPDNWSGNQ